MMAFQWKNINSHFDGMLNENDGLHKMKTNVNMPEPTILLIADKLDS